MGVVQRLVAGAWHSLGGSSASRTPRLSAPRSLLRIWARKVLDVPQTSALNDARQPLLKDIDEGGFVNYERGCKQSSKPAPTVPVHEQSSAENGKKRRLKGIKW
jgi:hypothetical protein